MSIMYWLYLFDEVFLWNKRDIAFFYNCRSGRGFKFKHDTNSIRIIHELETIENLYCIEIENKELEIKSTKELIAKIENSGCGILINREGRRTKPISFVPIVSINKDRNILKLKEIGFLGEEVMKNLNTIFLYINGECGHNCPKCKEAFYQFPFCTKNNDCITFEKIKSLTEAVRNIRLKSINILGGDMSKLRDADKIFNEFSQLPVTKVYYLHVLNINTLIFTLFRKYNCNQIIKLLIDLSLDKRIIERGIRKILHEGFNVVFSFVVTDIAELKIFATICKEFKLINYEIKPFYNKANRIFFQEYTYIDKADIKKIRLSKREIFIHQTLNINNFGSLVIMPNLIVFANVNDPELGYYNNLPELVYKEMTIGKSWFRIRDEQPCKDCVYQWLCPSPSNYEIVLEKSNLCTIVNN